MTKRFNKDAAQKVVDAVLEAMSVSDEIDLGPTRKMKLPSIVKQTSGWEVDETQFKQFKKVVHLLNCAIFGVDSDGDRAVEWIFVNRKTDATPLPDYVVPHRDLREKSEEKLWAGVEAAKGNLHTYQESFDRELRMFTHVRQQNARKRLRLKRAKGCDECKETGYIRLSWDDRHKHEEYLQKAPFRRNDLDPMKIDCPKCQQEALAADYKRGMADAFGDDDED